RSNWKTQWGLDYSLYRPVFEAARELRAPLVALNLPRGWVRRIGRQGPAALEPGEAIWAPDIDTDTPDHLKVFTALLGGHPLAGERGRNMHAAQVSWDEAMAQTAVDWMAGVRSRKAVMVILAGSGHALYGQGINLRLSRKGHPSLTVIGSEVGSVRDGVMSSVGEFLYVSPDVPRS
ncbi:MAG: ChaN family lipoprotein, partial [Fimbriimonadaceae bacterium]|nr:ChaN family lipoprotein [Fimbriimonadaceae bacterium]